MTYRIAGLDPKPIQTLFALDDAALAERNARRVTAAADRGFPCRVSLTDRAIGEKVLQNSVVNTEAAFDAAQAIARAKTFPEAVRLQANFVQQQLAVASSQTKELFELSTKVAKQTFETLNVAATKGFEQLKKAS